MPTPDTLDELQSRIGAALERFPNVRVAYLFGSRVQGKARPDSDLDLGLSFSAELSSAPRGELMLEVLSALSAELGALGERVDLLDLDRASSTIGFRVVSTGRCVLCREPRDRVRLEALIARRFDDERPYRELFRRAARTAAERMGGASRG